MSNPGDLVSERDAWGRRLADRLAHLVIEGVEDYAIFALNPEGHIVSWNPGAEQITGYAEEEAIGRHYSLLLPEEDRAVGAGARALQDAARHGRLEGQGWRIRQDGTRFWAHELVTALFLEAGHLLAFAVVLRDRTEQRLAEEARRRSEEMFAGIVNTSADAIVSVDESQRIILFNRAAEEIFGLPADEAIGKPLDILIPEPYREVHRRHVREFAESPVESRLMGERGAQELVGVRRSGEVFPIEAAISKTWVGGEWVFTAVVRDISRRVRNARARDFLSRASVVLDSSLDYETTLRDVAHLAVPDLADWCIVYVAEDTGVVRRLEVAHRDPELETVLAELRRYSIEPGGPHPVLGAIERGEPVLIADFPPALVERIAQDEEHLQILRRLGLRSAVIAPLVARGRALGAIGLYSSSPHRRYDEFDRALVEEVGYRAGLAVDNARLYREARHAVRLRDEVVSVVSHDLRNPLNTIVMSAQLALDTLDGEPPAETVRGSLEMVVRSADRMNRLIQDLLDISRLEGGRMVLELQPTDAGAVLRDARESFAPLARERGLDLEMEVEEDLPPVRADPDRLHQVLSNLVGNALKFTPGGGRITLGARGRPGEVVFRVSDTGVGIPEKHLPHLFDRFWQATRADRQGIGLGLPIVKGIVETHGGEVWVESREGEGATFFFTIPAD